MDDLLVPNLQIQVVTYAHLHMAFGAAQPLELVFTGNKDAAVRVEVFFEGERFVNKGFYGTMAGLGNIASPHPPQTLAAFEVAHVFYGPILLQIFFTGPRHADNDPELCIQAFTRERGDTNAWPDMWFPDHDAFCAIRDPLMQQALPRKLVSPSGALHRGADKLHVWF